MEWTRRYYGIVRENREIMKNDGLTLWKGCRLSGINDLARHHLKKHS